ncbi:MAG TPA: aminotransferase class V-fold PLP-dependent enzyme, partial [Actinomycetota bacterium]
MVTWRSAPTTTSTGGAPRRPSLSTSQPAAASTWWRAAARPVKLAICPPVTNPVLTDDSGTIDVEDLEKVLAHEPERPTIVCLQAGNVNTGASDDFARAVPLAKEVGAWVHVDGAFGLWAAAAPGRAHLVDGVGLADSWATDAHKWLNVPYD